MDAQAGLCLCCFAHPEDRFSGVEACKAFYKKYSFLKCFVKGSELFLDIFVFYRCVYNSGTQGNPWRTF